MTLLKMLFNIIYLYSFWSFSIKFLYQNIVYNRPAAPPELHVQLITEYDTSLHVATPRSLTYKCTSHLCVAPLHIYPAHDEQIFIKVGM
jgi:hypothetical protein